MNYKINDKNQVTFQYQNNNKLPNHIYNLHQSSYTNYNWYNDFKNEKNNAIIVDAKTQWINATLQVSTLKDFLYFQNTSSNDTIQLIIPKQYDKTINYLSLKVNKEFKFWKLGLDNTLLFQKADQDNLVLNVPELVTRNTFYFTDYFFKKALYLQTGITFNYFTKYYANDYNPVVSEFFVQNKNKLEILPIVIFSSMPEFVKLEFSSRQNILIRLSLQPIRFIPHPIILTVIS